MADLSYLLSRPLRSPISPPTSPRSTGICAIPGFIFKAELIHELPSCETNRRRACLYLRPLKRTRYPSSSPPQGRKLDETSPTVLSDSCHIPFIDTVPIQTSMQPGFSTPVTCTDLRLRIWGPVASVASHPASIHIPHRSRKMSKSNTHTGGWFGAILTWFSWKRGTTHNASKPWFVFPYYGQLRFS